VRSDTVSVMISQFYFFVDSGSFNFLPTRRHGQEKILYFCTLEFWGFISNKYSMNEQITSNKPVFFFSCKLHVSVVSDHHHHSLCIET
jgi:hypothetical protein